MRTPRLAAHATIAVRHAPFRPIRSVCFAILLLVSCGVAARAESEAAVKAAYLLNFAKLVDWPASSFARGPSLIVGVLGRDPVGDELARDLPGLSANGHTIEVRHVSAGDTAALLACHLLFVPDSERGPRIINALRGHPVLVIGESKDFAAQGGALGFVIEAGTVKFEANPESAEKNGLILRANLLRVARRLF